ncbi:hypothetical protein [Rhodanobacter hydrolyticus]|uniref:Uncharacterized protein n=1 Tax=Rhodanobacter hydrolyticus TaxID=2250595 RepID=A0ABW8J3U7_9GAMM
MMQLRALVNGYTQVVNQNLQAVPWLQSTGYTTDSNGRRTPMTVTNTGSAQVQAVAGALLRHIDALNITGVLRSVYWYGNLQSVVRTDQQGGDILQFPEIPGGPVRNWLVTTVIETWPDWAHVIVTLQTS